MPNSRLCTASFFLGLTLAAASCKAESDYGKRQERMNSGPGMNEVEPRRSPLVTGAPVSPEVPARPGNSDNVRLIPGLPKDALLPGNPPVTYVISPSAPGEADAPLVKGCWAKLYDEDSLRGDSITVYGPIAIPDPGGARVFDIDWKDRISSIVTGPSARLLVYDNKNYKDLVSTIKPSQSLKVNKEIGYFDEINSLKLQCTRTKSAKK